MPGNNVSMMECMDRKGQRGAAAIEFAIVAPVLILILLGTIEMGLLLYDNQVITNASREGARSAIAQGQSESLQTIIDNYCSNRLINLKDGWRGSATGTLTPVGTDHIQVNVSYEYNYLFFTILGLNQTTLNAQTTMRVE